MNYLKKSSLFLMLVVGLLFSANSLCAQQAGVASQYKYQSVANDPLNARIYKLANGFTVYMTVYKDSPRIQAYIAVKAGSKNDPADATGLAHYLEHMVFKGTDKFGTKDFVKEEPLLKQIENLYETYRKTTDEQQRKKIYHQIDSISGVAAKYAIANEYDKMMAAIGAQGSNASTDNEETLYYEDIPSNQLENWLNIQAERFRKPVLRIFHTELEAVYEEKNRALDNDGRKMFESLFAGLFQKHTYGTQTTIGTVEHLKNPSITKIQQYYDTYYVPNNMALCLSGDFNPDQAIKLIDNYFGKLKSKPVKPFVAPKEDPITKPIEKNVYGPDAETMLVGFRFPGANSKDADLLTLVDKILYNNTAGLLDLNINQAQKALSAGTWLKLMKDYSIHIIAADPKEGQSLEQLKDLLLSQLELIKKGDFPDWLLPAIINNMKLNEVKSYEDNTSRANAFVSAFTLEHQWESYVNRLDRLSKITKQEVMDFVRQNYLSNYVVVYKRTGEDKNIEKVVKPAITPVEVNRHDQSPFLKSVVESKTETIAPVFIDFAKDIQKLTLNGTIPVYYKENTENSTFSLYYLLDMGSNHNKKLPVAIDYLPFLGTSKYSPVQIQQEFYKLACSFNIYNSEDQVYVSLNGLAENFDKAVQLFEELLKDAQPNPAALDNLVSDILKKRADAKLSKRTILFSGLYNYAIYGGKNPYTNVLSETELKALKADELVALIKELTAYQHSVMYYGPLKTTQLLQSLTTNHKTSVTLKPVPVAADFMEQPINEGKVYVVDYDMKQAEILFVAKGEKYNKNVIPDLSMFNEYFGGGMSSVVFQDLRESKALAYSVFAGYRIPERKDKSHYMVSYIGTQVDKLPESIGGMTALLNNMPEAEMSFSAAKDLLLQNIRTERVNRTDVLFRYYKAQKLGIDYDIRKDIYQRIPQMSMSDVKKFQETYVKNKNYALLVLGNKQLLDIKTLEKYGKVEFLKLEDIFGY